MDDDPMTVPSIVWNADEMGAGCLADAAWVSGTAASGHRHIASGNVDTAALPVDVVEQLGNIVGSYQNGSGDHGFLIDGPGWLATVFRSDWAGRVRLKVSALSFEVAAGEMDRLAGLFPPVHLDTEATLHATYWFATSFGPSTFRGELPLVPWASMAGNYTAPVGEAFDRLCSMTAPDADTGKVILLHGPPGTGKSRMLAALAGEWRSWADLHVISDPAQFFEDRSYLLSVAEATAMGDRWAVMVLEDADKFIDQRQLRGPQQGDGINALLNMADGMLGVAMNVIFVLTTNVEMEQFDAALLRPGRSLANIHVPRLTQTEAVAWLTDRGHAGTPVGEDGASIAELYDRIRPATQTAIVASGAAPAMSKTIVRVHSPAQFTVDPKLSPIVASGGTVTPISRFPVEPPREWFARRKFDRCTPVETTRDGQVFGHVWDWTKPHIGYHGQQIMPPRSRSGYAEFLNKHVWCEDGTKVRTGVIYLDCDHAPLHLGLAAARDAMAHTGRAVCDVMIYEDEWGGQIAGAMRPRLAPEFAREFTGSDISPDWRPASRGHEMVGMVCVNTSGYIVSGGALVASGGPRITGPRVAWDHETDQPLAMVAVGMVRHNREDEVVELRREVRALAVATADLRAEAVMARIADNPRVVALHSEADEIVARLSS